MMTKATKEYHRQRKTDKAGEDRSFGSQLVIDGTPDNCKHGSQNAAGN